MGRRVLVARETARQLQNSIERAFEENPKELGLDFAGTDVMNPSFFDEVLKVVSPHLARDGSARLVITNSPVSLAEFESIGETYGLKISRRGSAWAIKRSRRARLLGG